MLRQLAEFGPRQKIMLQRVEPFGKLRLALEPIDERQHQAIEFAAERLIWISPHFVEKRRRGRCALRFSSPSQSAMKEAKSTWRNLASTGAASRKCTSMNSPSLSAMRCWLLWMIAVCGIGNPKGLRNSATTAYQSANPPMVAASANAAIKPKIGCNGSSAFAVTNRLSAPPSTSVASALTRRNSAARAASPGVSNEDVADEFMAAFGPSH